MKKFAALASLLVLGLVQNASAAAVYIENPVEALAAKAVAKDVRTIVDTVEQAQANGCSDAGVYYVVQLQIQKSEVVPNSKGDAQVVRKWETVNTYRVAAKNLGVPFRRASLSDAPCLE